MSRSPVAESVRRIDVPLCPGSMTMTGPGAAGVREAVGAGDADGTAEVEGVAATADDGTTGLRVGVAVAGSGENTVCGGAGSTGRAWGSDEPQPVRPTARPSATRATALRRAATRALVSSPRPGRP